MRNRFHDEIFERSHVQKSARTADLCFLPHEKFIAWSCLNRNGRIAGLGNVMRERTKGIFETATVFWRSNRLVSLTRSDSFTYLKALTRARCGSRNVECRPPKKMDPALQLFLRFKLLFFPFFLLSTRIVAPRAFLWIKTALFRISREWKKREKMSKFVVECNEI